MDTFRYILLGTIAALQAGTLSASERQGQVADWAALPDLVQSVPPPPERVADGRQYEATIAARLQALETQLEQYETRLEQLTEQAEGGDGRAVVQELSLAREQLQAALARKAQQQTDNPQLEASETAAMQDAVGLTASQPDRGQANAVVLAFSQSSAQRGLREQQAEERLERDWQAQDARCEDDQGCVQAAERAHFGNVAQFKNTVYPEVRRDWFKVSTKAKAFGAEVERIYLRAAGPARDRGAELLESDNRALSMLGKMEPLRLLVGMFGLLLGESRNRWDEAAQINAQMAQ